MSDLIVIGIIVFIVMAIYTPWYECLTYSAVGIVFAKVYVTSGTIRAGFAGGLVFMMAGIVLKLMADAEDRRAKARIEKELHERGDD